MKYAKLTRNIEATEVPSGLKNLYPKGTEFRISQSLGDFITIVTRYGTMARVELNDVSALGEDGQKLIEKILTEQKRILEIEDLEEQIWESLKLVYDPEIPINLVDLGLIYEVNCQKDSDGKADIDLVMTLTSPTCGMSPMIQQDVENKITALPRVKRLSVKIVFDPPWTRDMVSMAAKLELGWL